MGVSGRRSFAPRLRQRRVTTCSTAAGAEAPDEALKRRLRESQRVDERVKYIYNSEDWHRELGNAGSGLVVLEVHKAPHVPSPVAEFALASPGSADSLAQWRSPKCTRRVGQNHPHAQPTCASQHRREPGCSCSWCLKSVLASTRVHANVRRLNPPRCARREMRRKQSCTGGTTARRHSRGAQRSSTSSRARQGTALKSPSWRWRSVTLHVHCLHMQSSPRKCSTDEHCLRSGYVSKSRRPCVIDNGYAEACKGTRFSELGQHSPGAFVGGERTIFAMRRLIQRRGRRCATSWASPSSRPCSSGRIVPNSGSTAASCSCSRTLVKVRIFQWLPLTQVAALLS